MIELSADLGEGAPGEAELWPLLDAANVACGGHTGDADSMGFAVRMAREHGVELGAHPSYPDREHFGRRSLPMSHGALRDTLAEQLASLAAIAAEEGVLLARVKPHGALYNDAHHDRLLSDVIIAALRDVDPLLSLVAPDHSQMAAAARAAGVRVIAEAFADRRYEPDGSLTPRSIAGSTLSVDEAAAQAALLAKEGHVIARDGSRISVRFDTLCVHADMDGAVERLRAIRARI